MHKLSDTDVNEIRRLRAGGMTQVALGERFGVYRGIIRRWTSESYRNKAIADSASWHKGHPDYNQSWLKNHPGYQQARRRNHPDYDRSYANRLKSETLGHYSGGTPRCAICGETDLDMLALDHIGNDGGGARRPANGAGHGLYARLRREHWPFGFQCLCHNHNRTKEADRLEASPHSTNAKAIRTANHNHDLKAECLRHYSGGVPKCAECGEEDIRCLELDHVNEGGRKERIAFHGGVNLYARLKRLGWPDGKYQVLCCNHNLKKEMLRRRSEASERRQER